MARIHFLAPDEDKHRYEAQAAREGLSLGAWLREAAEERYRAARSRAPFDSPEEVESFFQRCDEGEVHDEPDWVEHRKVLERSRSVGLDPT